MRKYAQLAVRRGINVKKGQGCVISAQVEQFEFAQMVAEEAYRGRRQVGGNALARPGAGQAEIPP